MDELTGVLNNLAAEYDGDFPDMELNEDEMAILRHAATFVHNGIARVEMVSGIHGQQDRAERLRDSLVVFADYSGIGDNRGLADNDESPDCAG